MTLLMNFNLVLIASLILPSNRLPIESVGPVTKTPAPTARWAADASTAESADPAEFFSPKDPAIAPAVWASDDTDPEAEVNTHWFSARSLDAIENVSLAVNAPLQTIPQTSFASDAWEHTPFGVDASWALTNDFRPLARITPRMHPHEFPMWLEHLAMSCGEIGPTRWMLTSQDLSPLESEPDWTLSSPIAVFGLD